MNPLANLTVAIAHTKQRIARAVLLNRICALNPTLRCDPTVIWNYPFAQPEIIEMGRDVNIHAFCEILVFPRSRFSSQEGKLILGDGAVIAAGANIRAAGGTIRIGAGSGIGQHSVVVAANHQTILGEPYFKLPWDEVKVGVEVGANVWVAAGCVLLPGTRIGDNSLIAAGSVVNSVVPAGEIWGGAPARRLKAVPGRMTTAADQEALNAAQKL